MRFIHGRTDLDNGHREDVLINPAHVKMVRWSHPHYSRFDAEFVMDDGTVKKVTVDRETMEELGLPIREHT